MGSRLKQNPERTFHWFFQATCPVARDKDPGVLFQFPEDFSDEESCQTLPKFCFPYDIQRARAGVAVQHFTFVLTDLEGCQRFGFCRLTNSTHTCLCILSYLPWFEVFYKLLNNLADYLTKGQTSEMKALLGSLYKQPIPLAAGSITLQMVPYFIAPDPRSLPSIPENRNLTELIVAVDVGNLLQVYASMLFERRILIFASKLSTLTACVHALSAVLYPMYWQHIFIPVLPPHLLDYCCAPMPFLIGVHCSLSERVRSRGLEEVVILNVDTNTVETPFDDLKRIPSDVMSGLKLCLKRQAVSPGPGVSRAFLKAQALLFGGYRDALQGHEEGEICFSERLFLDHKSHSMGQFLQSAVHLQFFKQFIDDRLDILNTGEEPDDLFEDEILKCETTTGTSKSYQQLVGNLKKGGGALILNMKSKANMRAKGLAKAGWKNLLMHKANNEGHSLQRGGSVSHRRAQSDCLQNRLPITAHFGMSRPLRPGHKHRAARDQDNVKDTEDTWDGAVSGPALKPDTELHEDEEDGEDALLSDPEEMDLLGEIFDTLSSRSSHERGLLYGTRSLDLFGPDSHDYITKFGRVNPSQESLCLSISGSGSLHSWNLDSECPYPDPSVPEGSGSECLRAMREMEQQERGQREDDEKQEEVKVEINRNQGEEIENRRTFEEVRFEEVRVSPGEEPVEETSEKREDEGLKEQREDERNQSDESAKGIETQRETNETQKVVASEEEGNENQDEEEVTRSFNKMIQLKNHHPNLVEERQGRQEADVHESAASPGPQSPTADPTAAAGQGRSEEEVKKDERWSEQQMPSPPKVQSSVARFQSQASGPSFQMKSGIKGLAEPGRLCNVSWSNEKTQAHRPRDSNTSGENNCSGAHEGQDAPPVKVSELKKRFEA